MKPAIEIEHLRYRWPRSNGDVLAIDGLSVGVGEKLFIKGPSGSGKTTLLNLIAGLFPPVAGDIFILGHALGRLSGAARDAVRADHLGFVFQQFNLLPYLSLAENVLLPCRFSRRRCERARATQGSLAGAAAQLLQKLGLDDDELHSRGVHEFSLGQQQRVAVARALIGAPEILIADEPTSALDADSQRVFLELLFQACAEYGTTLVFVSHDTRLEPRFDRVVALPDINGAATGAI